MVDILAHRGPDATGTWVDGPLGFGHRLLQTTPESFRERLPFDDGSRNLVITADARIDNRDELIDVLALGSSSGNEPCDSELILAAYTRWGDGCLEHLIGDFAFVIWDRSNRRLFGARDHLGIRPFYYHYSRNRLFAFASEIKALLCHPKVPRCLNEVKVADYLLSIWEDEEITFYQDILRLPPGHCLAVDGRGMRLREYWAPDLGSTLRLGSDEQYAEAFRELFAEAVRCRLRSSSPVGFTLSGGLDSSAVMGMARWMAPGRCWPRMHTFSAVFPTLSRVDERLHIDRMLEDGGFEPHFIRGDQLSPLVDIERALWHHDEPFGAPNLFLEWGMYGVARELGIRVILDGMDGDLTVSYGLAYIPELLIRGRWMALHAELTNLARRMRSSPWGVLRYEGLRRLAPEGLRRTWRRLRGHNPYTWSRFTTVNPEFARRIGLKERADALLDQSMRPIFTQREEHRRHFASGLLAFSNEVGDKVGAAFAVDHRHPFFDKRLVDFCLALPPHQKLNKGWDRVVMRRAMQGILPDSVRWRGDKSNLSGGFYRGLLETDRSLLEEIILENPQVIQEYVDIPSLKEHYRVFLANQGGDDSLPVWSAVTLGLWLRQSGL